MDLRTFANLLRNGKSTSQPVTEICGRIIRGINKGDFNTLSDDPDRKIVMLVDPDGLAKLLGKSGFEMLIEVGYEPDYLLHKVNEGNKFKLVVFQEGLAAKIATWDNVFEMVEQVYPDITFPDDIKSDLKSKSFNEIEAESGFIFLDIEKAGKSSPLFMTYDRFIKSDKTLTDFRAFLYFTVHLRELYSGDGWTYDSEGNRGVKEYIIPNLPLKNLGDHEIIDINVTIPSVEEQVEKAGKNVAEKNLGYHMDLQRLPSFFDPRNIFNPFYRANLGKAREEGLALKLRPASKQIKESGANLLIGIDLEQDFMDYFRYIQTLPYLYGRLPVTGALEDMLRICYRIIKGVYEEHYTTLMMTLDQHPVNVIHGDTWWKDENGKVPDVSLPVQMELIDEAEGIFKAHFIDGSPSKYFKPVFMKDWSVQYAKHLNETNQGFIWVFAAHCRQATDGIDLHPVLSEVIEWACAARKMEPIYLFKGHIAQVDWFGPFEPCMKVDDHPQGGTQTAYLDMIKHVKVGKNYHNTNSIEITGQAKDFCVFHGTNQVMKFFGGEKDILSKIKFINDCTSAIVPTDPKLAQFEKDMADQGLKLINYDSPF